MCAETISSLTHWNETAPHAEILSYISVYGICVENSEPEVIGKLPRAMCKVRMKDEGRGEEEVLNSE